ncbi:MAG: hypothetical protein HYU78_00310 [Rhodocyclales bacterium]|nr:hypothetical protein [Rhodocyclales bacterium]
MAIESVGSSAQASVSSSRQTAETRQAEQQQPAPKPEQRAERNEEAPRPVKNAEGQTTGTRINVIA